MRAMKSDKQKLQEQVAEVFRRAFGRTSLRERMDDINREARELDRSTDMRHTKEEVGDLAASLIQLCNECEWDFGAVVQAAIAKIEARMPQYQTLGRKLQVAILGGAFDPVTTGHIGVAEFVLNTSRTFDEVWLMPCFRHMHGKEMAPAEHRLEMCRLASASNGCIRVFDYEIVNRLRGETFNLVKRLLEDDAFKDEHNFSIIIGQDNANSFDKWVNYQLLEQLIRFVVVPRQGVASPLGINHTWYFQPPHIYLQAAEPIVKSSSTDVRRMLSERNHAVEKLVDHDVLGYITDHNLYRDSQP